MTPTPPSRVATHGRALIEIAVISAIGILATAGFQIVAARGLGADEFGLFASFLAIINVIAVGSSALRSSVAVATASAEQGAPDVPRTPRFWDGAMIEATVLGALAIAILLICGPFLITSLESSWLPLLVTILSVMPYFYFARAQGMLQGVGATRSVVWWTTGSQLLQLGLILIAVMMQLGVAAALATVMLTALVGTLGSSLQLRRQPIVGQSIPFTARSIVVLLLTAAFAWTTNADVILVRAGASAAESGAYAAGAVLVKTMLIVPSLLSLYLLPRFVRAAEDHARSRQGLNLTLLLTFVTGAAIVGGLWLLGGPIVQLLYGPDYALTAALLPAMGLMCLPWAMAQSVLIRVTAVASPLGLLVALAAAGLQLAAFGLALPDLPAAILLNGIVGVFVLVGLYGAHLLKSRAARP